MLGSPGRLHGRAVGVGLVLPTGGPCPLKGSVHGFVHDLQSVLDDVRPQQWEGPLSCTVREDSPA